MSLNVGVLLAAGRGRRMGTTKQLLPWRDHSGETTLIGAAFDSLAQYCQCLIVVVGQDAESVVDALGKRVFESVMGDPDAPMFESIRAGLEAASRREGVALVMVHPADHPQVESSTMHQLIDAHESNPDRAVMPEYEGRGGHPVLIPIGLVDAIRAYDGEGGLRAFWQKHPDVALRVPVRDPFVICDVDTPEAYERIRARWRAAGGD